jgi:hypothetical protein
MPWSAVENLEVQLSRSTTGDQQTCCDALLQGYQQTAELPRYWVNVRLNKTALPKEGGFENLA